jgi:hypothetical protein
VLVFSGEFYLDEQGLPTPKSTAVFNMFKYLAMSCRTNITWSINRLNKTRGSLALFVYISGFLSALPPAQQQSIGAFRRATGKAVEHFLRC